MHDIKRPCTNVHGREKINRMKKYKNEKLK